MAASLSVLALLKSASKGIKRIVGGPIGKLAAEILPDFIFNRLAVNEAVNTMNARMNAAQPAATPGTPAATAGATAPSGATPGPAQQYTYKLNTLFTRMFPKLHLDEARQGQFAILWDYLTEPDQNILERWLMAKSENQRKEFTISCLELLQGHQLLPNTASPPAEATAALKRLERLVEIPDPKDRDKQAILLGLLKKSNNDFLGEKLKTANRAALTAVDGVLTAAETRQTNSRFMQIARRLIA